MSAIIDYMRRHKTAQEAYNLNADELIEQIKSYLQPVLEFVETAEDNEFVKRFKQPFGSGGPPRYFFQLCHLVRTKYADFKPEGFDELLTEQKTEVTEKADAINKSVVDRVHAHVISGLKTNYLSEYFEKGIPQKDIKLGAIGKKYDDKDSSMPPENYLDVIELKKIIEHPQNWELFKGTMNIQMPGEKKGQAKYLKWLEKLNEVRRIPAHPYGRSYQDEDIEFLEFIDEQLEARNV